MILEDARIDAIACYNDEVASETVKMLIKMGKRVPEDISVTGFDDSYLAESCPVKLTTARHPKKELGRAAAELVLELISSGSSSSAGSESSPGSSGSAEDASGNALSDTPIRILKPELVIRNSTSKK
jgi:GntR family transcriptional regulator of arabinose operon